MVNHKRKRPSLLCHYFCVYLCVMYDFWTPLAFLPPTLPVTFQCSCFCNFTTLTSSQTTFKNIALKKNKTSYLILLDLNWPIPSCLLPLLQNEYWCKIFHLKMSFTHMFIFRRIKLFFSRRSQLFLVYTCFGCFG